MTTASQRPYDKLCGGRHWTWEDHVYPKGFAVRPMVKEFVRSEPATVPVKAVSVTSARDKTLSVTRRYANPIDGKLSCKDCGNLYTPKRSTSLYCSATCRKRASRRKTG